MTEKRTVVKEDVKEVKMKMIEMEMIAVLVKYDDESDEESAEGAGCCQCFMKLHFLSMLRAADLVEGSDAPSTVQVTVSVQSDVVIFHRVGEVSSWRRYTPSSIYV